MNFAVPGWTRTRRVTGRPLSGVSREAASLDRSLSDARRHWRETITSREGSLEDEFQRLARTWKEETEFQSSLTHIAMHPAYQRIIGMGPDALPLILGDLASNPAPWFWALAAISGDDPVPLSDRGRVDRMAEAWLRWGMRRNLL